MERIMSDLDQLHEIIDALPPQQVHALLTLLAAPQPISDEEFARRLAMAPEEEVDEETTARILAAEAERGEIVSHGELKQRLVLGPFVFSPRGRPSPPRREGTLFPSGGYNGYVPRFVVPAALA